MGRQSTAALVLAGLGIVGFTAPAFGEEAAPGPSWRTPAEVPSRPELPPEFSKPDFRFTVDRAALLGESFGPRAGAPKTAAGSDPEIAEEEQGEEQGEAAAQPDGAVAAAETRQPPPVPDLP